MKNKLMSYCTKVCKLLALLTGSRKRRNIVIQKKLAPYEFSILCNNCLGGYSFMMLANDLILR